MLSGLADYVSGAWWSYLVVLGLAYLDVLFPLVPSETAVITAGVLAGAGDMHLALIIACGAVGAVLGDNTAYVLGRYFEQPVRRRFFSSEKAEARIRWADKQLEERGGELIVVARFIPAGRTAVTLACGWLHMPWWRFIVFDIVAGLVWASYASLLGYFGGKTFEHSPWKGLLIALAIGFGVTGAVELVRWALRRRKGRAAHAAESD